MNAYGKMKGYMVIEKLQNAMRPMTSGRRINGQFILECSKAKVKPLLYFHKIKTSSSCLIRFWFTLVLEVMRLVSNLFGHDLIRWF